MKAGHKNVTLSLPEPLLRRFRVFAAERNQSMTSIMAEALEKTMEQENERKAAGRRLLERMRNAPDRGLGGKVTWSREDIYAERMNKLGPR